MKIGRFTAAIAGAVVLAMTAGCSQEIVYREFFAPTDDVKLVREDGSTVGAVKIEATRHGVPNWSDHKTLSVSSCCVRSINLGVYTHVYPECMFIVVNMYITG